MQRSFGNNNGENYIIKYFDIWAPLTVAPEHRAPCYFFHQATKIANCPAKLATSINSIINLITL